MSAFKVFIIAAAIAITLLLALNINSHYENKKFEKSPGVIEVGSTTLTDEEFLAQVNYKPSWWEQVKTWLL